MATLVCSLINVYLIVIFARILLSWFPIAPNSPLVGLQRILGQVTEPVLGRLRTVLPIVRVGGTALDLAPLAVFAIAFVLVRIICG